MAHADEVLVAVKVGEWDGRVGWFERLFGCKRECWYSPWMKLHHALDCPNRPKART